MKRKGNKHVKVFYNLLSTQQYWWLPCLLRIGTILSAQSDSFFILPQFHRNVTTTFLLSNTPVFQTEATTLEMGHGLGLFYPRPGFYFLYKYMALCQIKTTYPEINEKTHSTSLSTSFKYRSILQHMRVSSVLLKTRLETAHRDNERHRNPVWPGELILPWT